MFFQSRKKSIIIFFVLIVVVGVGYIVLERLQKYDTENPSQTRAFVRDQKNQTQDSLLGSFARDNFGFDVDMNAEEYSRLGILCNEAKTPDKFNSQEVPGKIVCNGGSPSRALWMGWKREGYSKVNYERDMGNQMLSLIPGAISGQSDCKETSDFRWYAKMPATIVDCSLTSNEKVYSYSVLFFYPHKIDGISQAITVFSLDANVPDQAQNISKNIRSFAERIRYLELSKKKNKQQSFLFVKRALASAGVGADSGSASVGCTASDAAAAADGTAPGCGADGTAGTAGGTGGGDAGVAGGDFGPVCANGAADYPLCTVACVSDGSCSAVAPACGTTTYGVNSCGAACSKAGGVCACVPVTTPHNCSDMNGPSYDPDDGDFICNVSDWAGTWTDTVCGGSTTYTWGCTGGNCDIPPINGMCSSVAENCTLGTYSDSPADTPTQYQWTCLGSGGGADSPTCPAWKCTPKTCDDYASERTAYCASTSKPKSQGCGLPNLSCSGTRYCDFNWKEVRP